MARIRSAIRRNNTDNKEPICIYNDLEIDLISRTVKKNNQYLKLTTTEFNLLSLFIKNEGRVLTHQFLLKEIWGVGSQTETQYLRVFVGTLRKKIENNPLQPTHIITESGVGYRFQ
jgi:two-component system KDP operon response regulator KdpE